MPNYLSSIQLPDGEIYNLKDKTAREQYENLISQINNLETAFIEQLPEFIISNNITSTAELTGQLKPDSNLYDGKIIYYFITHEMPSTPATLKLQYGTSDNYTESIPIFSYGVQRSTTPYPSNFILTLIYYNEAFYLASNNIGIVL